jgi:Bax protein
MSSSFKVLIISVIALTLAGFYYLSLPAETDFDAENNVNISSEMTVIEDKVIDKPKNINVPDFNKYKNVTEKKKAFFAYLLPEIKYQNQLISAERERVLKMQALVTNEKKLNTEQIEFLNSLRAKYKVAEELSIGFALKELTTKVDVIPAELVLVQAANESGWGTSRFAKNGYNFFGLWCFKKGCGFVPKQRNKGTIHEVAKFRDLSHAVMTYARNLNRHYAYADLRDIRQKLRNKNKPVTAQELVHGLMSYSERGEDYIDELLSMMRVNKKHMGI